MAIIPCVNSFIDDIVSKYNLDRDEVLGLWVSRLPNNHCHKLITKRNTKNKYVCCSLIKGKKKDDPVEEFCSKHTPSTDAPQTFQCKAIKKGGTQCTKKTIDESGLCNTHLKYQSKEPVEKKEQRMCQALYKKSQLPCKSHADGDSDYCKKHANYKKAEEKAEEKVYCSAVNKKGSQCKKLAIKGKALCSQHELINLEQEPEELEEEVEEEESEPKKTCTHKNRGKLCGRQCESGDRCDKHTK